MNTLTYFDNRRMTTSIEELSGKCPNCDRNIFEAVENGRCVWCGAEIEGNVLTAPCRYKTPDDEPGKQLMDLHESLCPKCKKIESGDKIWAEGSE